ncbi:MAG: O-antigen ligase family protein [Clostridiaceae bacterium]|nr:O-antigen ligase family protein [Clostridiaceae bacterium]
MRRLKKKDAKNLDWVDKAPAVAMIATIVLQGSYFPIEYMSISLVICIILLYRLSLKQDHVYINKSVMVLSLLLCSMYVISTVFVSCDKYAAATETFKVFGFMLFLAVCLTQRNKIALLGGTLIGILCVSVVGLTAYIGKWGIDSMLLEDRGLLRLQSIIQYANTTALLMGIGFFISLYFMERQKENSKKTVYAAVGYVLLISLVLTFSRSMIGIFTFLLVITVFCMRGYLMRAAVVLEFVLATAVGYLLNKLVLGGQSLMAVVLLCLSILLVVYVFLKLSSIPQLIGKTIYYIFVTLLFVVPAGIFAVVYFRKLDLLSLMGSTFASRLVYMQDGLSIILKNPIMGIGPGGWMERQFIYQTAQYFVRYVHNGFIQLALDAGVGALAVFIAIIVIFYVHIIRKYKKTHEFYYFIILMIMTLIMLHSLLDIDMSFLSVNAIIAQCIAIAVEDQSKGCSTKTGLYKRYVKPAMVIFLVITVYYIIGDISFQKAQQSFINKDFKTAERM